VVVQYLLSFTLDGDSFSDFGEEMNSYGRESVCVRILSCYFFGVDEMVLGNFKSNVVL
jgi:hypothetical protein